MTGFKRTITQSQPVGQVIQQIREIAFRDPDRFIQKQLKVADKLAGTVPFRYNWSQLQIARKIKEMEAAGKPLRLYILKSRQVGSSTMIACRYFVKTWAKDNVQALVLAQLEERSAELLERVKFFYSSLPAPLKLQLSKDSQYGLQYADTLGKITIASARNLAIARGATKQLLLLSEFAHYKNPRDLLKEFQKPILYAPGTEIIIETTGMGFGSQAHEFWQETRQGRTPYEGIFLPWQDDPGCSYEFSSDKDRDWRLKEAFEYEPRLKDRMQYHKLTPGNIYYAYLVLKNYCDGDYQDFLREYPCDEHEPWLSNNESFFGTENVNKLRDHTTQFPYQYRVFAPHFPLDETLGDQTSFDVLERADKVDENGSRPFFKIWKLPTPKGEYIVSGDAAEGIEDGNFSSSFVIDANTFEMMAEFHGRIRPDQFAYVMGFLGNVYNVALCAPEINPPGNVTFMELNRFYNNIYRFKSPYMDKVNGKNERQWLAWQTNHITRPMMLQLAKRLVEDLAHDRIRLPGIIKSRELVNELGTFAPDERTGKPQAINGAQDDRVMAWAIACIVASQETYGTERDILSLYKTNEENPPAPVMDLSQMQVDPMDVVKNFEQRLRTHGPKLQKDYFNG